MEECCDHLENIFHEGEKVESDSIPDFVVFQLGFEELMDKDLSESDIIEKFHRYLNQFVDYLQELFDDEKAKVKDYNWMQTKVVISLPPPHFHGKTVPFKLKDVVLETRRRKVNAALTHFNEKVDVICHSGILPHRGIFFRNGPASVPRYRLSWIGIIEILCDLQKWFNSLSD